MKTDEGTIELPVPGHYVDGTGRRVRVEEASIQPDGRDVRGQILYDGKWRSYSTSMTQWNNRDWTQRERDDG